MSENNKLATLFVEIKADRNPLSKSLADIQAMGLPTDKGAMFLLAVAIAILAVGVIFVERAKVQAIAKAKTKRPIGAFADA